MPNLFLFIFAANAVRGPGRQQTAVTCEQADRRVVFCSICSCQSEGAGDGDNVAEDMDGSDVREGREGDHGVCQLQEMWRIDVGHCLVQSFTNIR